MKVFIFFALTTAVVTAAPHAASVSDKRQHRSGKPDNSSRPESHHKAGERKKDLLSLKEIICSVKNFTPTAEAHQKEVQNVFMNEECNLETLCQAGNVLSAYNWSDLGLRREKDWRLPRRLHAYSKLQNCTIKGELETIPLLQFLKKIQSCVQKEFTNYRK
ncbi:Uncharacterized protein DAT39_005374 [Clarias magur]|uniref:Uncharacterized protein n=1 Tax=Clarias magur TaxID=1594786 RepID=A0A8J4X5R4_CLAMG|nr:Uncharacterized protein DAT39_005374 [Clarias magur]